MRKKSKHAPIKIYKTKIIQELHSPPPRTKWNYNENTDQHEQPTEG